MDESARALTTPTLLGGRYEVGELLGRGGMAEVHRAHDTVLGRDVAVKLFRDGSAVDGSVDRRAAEVRLLAGLSHANVVTVFDAGRDTSDPGDPFGYLVMELVEGTTLAREISFGPLAAAEVSRLGAQLGSALQYVHGRGVVHRDIKPANILLTGSSGSRQAKLTDFGVARLADSTRVTLVGTTVGTANYLSPEQATGAPIGPASDIYSLGLVLIEALTGQIVYPGHGVEAAVQRLHKDPALPAWLGPMWQDLLSAMTAREPERRPDATEVTAVLAALSGQDDAGTVPLPVATEAARRRPRALWLLAGLAGAGAAAAIVVGAVGASGSSNGTPLPPTPTHASHAAGPAAPSQSRKPTASRSSRSKAAAAKTARKPRPSATHSSSHPAVVVATHHTHAATPVPPAGGPAGPKPKPAPPHVPPAHLPGHGHGPGAPGHGPGGPAHGPGNDQG